MSAQVLVRPIIRPGLAAPAPQLPAGRRQSPVLRNLDDPLKLAGLLTMKSCGLLLMVFVVLQLVELVTGFFAALPPTNLPLVWQIVFTGVVGGVLASVERQQDQHFVLAALRYYAARPWRIVYSGLARDAWRESRIEKEVAAARSIPAQAAGRPQSGREGQ